MTTMYMYMYIHVHVHDCILIMRVGVNRFSGFIITHDCVPYDEGSCCCLYSSSPSISDISFNTHSIELSTAFLWPGVDGMGAGMKGAGEESVEVEGAEVEGA